MEKRYGILILGTFACAACFLLSACAGPAAEQSSVQPPYDGQTQVSMSLSTCRTCASMVATPAGPPACRW